MYEFCNVNLLRNIVKSNWLLHPDAATGYLPLIAQLINGQSVAFGQQPEVVNSIVSAIGVSSSGNPVQGRVAIMPIRGVILKDDQDCGPRGLETKGKVLQDWINDDKIDAIVIDLDTPGGQASYLETFTDIIASSKKPIIAYYNSLCASAGYYIASACNEIYASEKGDEVGSIGTMATMADYTNYFEQLGIKVHHIYADQSVDKNKSYRQITSGNPEEIEAGLKGYSTNVLTPLAQFFIDHVKTNRPLINDETVFSGKTYLTKDALANNLIDGQKSLEEVIQIALNRAIEQKNNSKTNNMNKFNTVATLLGYESIESKEGFVSLSEADVEKIDAALGTAGATETTLEVVAQDHGPAITALETKVDGISASVNSALATLTNSVAAMEAKLTEAIGGPGALKTETIVSEDLDGESSDNWPAPKFD